MPSRRATLIPLALAGLCAIACDDDDPAAGEVDTSPADAAATDAAPPPDSAPQEPPPRPDCCALSLICDLCGCDDAEARSLTEFDPDSCRATLDRRPAACAIDAGLSGPAMLETDVALEFCSADAAHDFGVAFERCRGCSTEACLPSSGGSFCTQRCTFPDAGCPAGTICMGVDLPDGGGCVPPGPIPFGGACGVSMDCRSLVCHRGACTVRCREDADCPPGDGCGDFYGDRYCSGTAAEGEACARDLDCDGRLPCTAGRCGWPGAALGEPCASDGDCASRLCLFVQPEEGYCSRVCDAERPCPDGFECFDGFPAVCARDE